MPEVKLELGEKAVKKVLEKFPGEPLEKAIEKAVKESINMEKMGDIKDLENEVERIHSVVHNLQRIVATTGDLLNSYSQVLNDIRLKLTELMDKIDGLESRINDLIGKFEESQIQVAPKPEVVPHEARESPKERSKERKTSAIGILKKQKVMFEADLASKIRNRDAFFERLRKDGALVLSLTDQRVAIDPEYWGDFLTKLKSLDTNSEKKIHEVLGKVGSELLKALSKNALAYFDATKKRWVVLLE